MSADRADRAQGGLASRLLVRSPRPALSRYLTQPFASVQLLLLTTFGLLAFGVLMSLSTTIAAASDGQGSIWSQVVKEAIFIAVGVPLFCVAARLSPRAYRRLAYPVALAGVFALCVVLVPGVGVMINGARRWVDIGPLQLQPSELAKLGFLLWGAHLLSRRLELGRLTRPRALFLPLLPGFLLFAGLVMLEPDLGTTCCFLLILLGLLWTVGIPLRYLVGVVLSTVAGVFVLAYAAPYRWQRMTTFLDPFKHKQTSGFHTVEGLYALASGGIFGVGLGQGTSKYGWVPNANSDYVFAVVGEELGLLGCLVVIGLFALLGFTGMRVAARNVDPFARILAGTATIWLCGQAIINIGYVVGLLPSTGIPLPFISAGGTSLLASFVVLGMLVSFARHEEAAVAAAAAATGRPSRWARWARMPQPKPYVAPVVRRRPELARPPSGASGRRSARPTARPERALPDGGRRERARPERGRPERGRPARPAAPAAARSRTAVRPSPPVPPPAPVAKRQAAPATARTRSAARRQAPPESRLRPTGTDGAGGAVGLPRTGGRGRSGPVPRGRR